MQSAAFLEKEVSELRTANERQKQKCTRSRDKYFMKMVSAPEAHELFVQPEAAIEAAAPPQAKKAFTTFTAAYESFTKVWSPWK